MELTKMKYPRMRAELEHCIHVLSDKPYQEKSWVKENGAHSNMDYAVHFIYDDAGLADDALGALGLFVKNEEEVNAIKKLVSSFDIVFEKYGKNLKDEDYIKTKEWDCVVEDAKALKKILDKNVDETWKKVEKELSHGPARSIPCPICGANLHVYDGESSYTPSIITRVIDCPACGAGNVLGLQKSS